MQAKFDPARVPGHRATAAIRGRETSDCLNPTQINGVKSYPRSRFVWERRGPSHSTDRKAFPCAPAQSRHWRWSTSWQQGRELIEQALPYQFDAQTTFAMETNAIKYGALKQSNGHLAVRWRLETTEEGAKPWLKLDWKESGVDMPSVPHRTGRQMASIALSRFPSLV
jgi:hypothetical protein